jgi:hypothetical protein
VRITNGVKAYRYEIEGALILGIFVCCLGNAEFQSVYLDSSNLIVVGNGSEIAVHEVNELRTGIITPWFLGIGDESNSFSNCCERSFISTVARFLVPFNNEFGTRVS